MRYSISPMQQVVQEVASGNDVPLINFPRLPKEASLRQQRHGVLGKEYFVDHVHTNIEGYRLLGLALLDQLIRQEIAKPVESWNDEKIEDLREEVMAGLDINAQAEALRTLAATLDWAGKLDEAYNVLMKAMESQGPHPMTYSLLARVLMRQGKYDEGIESIHQALAHYPEMTGIRQSLGELLEKQGKTDEANKYFREELQLTLRRKPNQYDAHYRLGVILRKQGEREEAIHHLSEAVRLKPEDAVFKNDLQQALAERDRANGRPISRH